MSKLTKETREEMIEEMIRDVEVWDYSTLVEFIQEHMYDSMQEESDDVIEAVYQDYLSTKTIN